MRFRLVEIEGYRLAVSGQSVPGNLAVHDLSAHDYGLTGVVFDLGGGYARGRRTLSGSKGQKARYAYHHEKSFAIRHIRVPLAGP